MSDIPDEEQECNDFYKDRKSPLDDDYWEGRSDDPQRKYKANGQDHRAKTPKKFVFEPLNGIRLNTACAALVEGWLPRQGIVVIWGPPKSGKSFVSEDIGLHLALGQTWFGNKVKQCPVVYFALEGAAAWGARIEAFRAAHDVPDDCDAPFFLVRTKLKLTEDYEDFIAQANQYNPGLVVIDTLNRSIVGSENKDQDMAAYISAAESIVSRLNCTVAIVHHGGWDGSHPRGHSSLSGAVDSQISVVKNADSGINVAKVELLKDGQEGSELKFFLQPITVGIDDDGNEITSCWVKLAESQAVDAPCELFLSLLRQFQQEGRDVSAKKGPTYAPTQFEGHPNASGVSAARLRTAMDMLLQQGRIRIEEHGPESRRRSKLVAAW